MHEYGFDPKFILTSLINIYVYFIDYKEFLEFIVKDERSFKPENFDKVISLKEDEKISIDYEVFDKFLLLVKDLKWLSKEIKANEINYDDAPEEFMDPITTVLMEDPVMLPSSKTILDRSTIGLILLI
jgi:ubiquitin conjugation factor E4 B